MKEIGEQLKQAREHMGVTIEEAADDLKLKPSQLEHIENGDRSIFPDMFTLKQIIKDYAKYLGFEHDKIEDEFNEFVFEYTSKIPLDAIKQANKEKEKEKEKEQSKEIKSPYTIEEKRTIPFTKVLFALIIVFIVIASYFIYKVIQNSNEHEQTSLSYFN